MLACALLSQANGAYRAGLNSTQPMCTCTTRDRLYPGSVARRKDVSASEQVVTQTVSVQRLPGFGYRTTLLNQASPGLSPPTVVTHTTTGTGSEGAQKSWCKGDLS